MTSGLSSTYFRYWGKAEKDGNRFHLLPYHCLDVAAVGHCYLINNPSFLKKISEISGLDEHMASRWLVLLCMLHDAGKFSIRFQNLRPDILQRLHNRTCFKPYDVRHDSLGLLALKSILDKNIISLFFGSPDEPGEWEDVLLSVFRACSGHHGMPPRMDGPNNMPLHAPHYFEPEDLKALHAFITEAGKIPGEWQSIMVSPGASDLEDRLIQASWLIAGFLVLSDWIGSNSIWFPFHETPMPLVDYWRDHALPQAERALKEAGIGKPKAVPVKTGFYHLFPIVSQPTPLQQHAGMCQRSDSPQLYILEDVTGSGKTEAALLLAARMISAGSGSGLFMGLPTMATSNAMYERMISIYRRLYAAEETPSLVLSHAARHLSAAFMSSVFASANDEEAGGDETPKCTPWLSDNRKKALLADVGVGTIDQALLAVLPSRFQSLRLFGLIGHILIIDEVHAYDPYMNKLLQNLLSFHSAFGGSAILLSATLPAKIRRELIYAFARGSGGNENSYAESRAYPLITAFSPKKELVEIPVEAFSARRCSVAVRLMPDQDEIEQLILEAADKGRCVCWIRNTVHDALIGYMGLMDRMDNKDNLMLFHARFAMGDRLEREQAVTDVVGKKSTHENRRGKVLIATQVVEQSLDLDFDLLITDLAPMDLVIQRAGRLHRHLRDEKGNPLQEGPDRRKPPLMIIHGPEPCENAPGDWYSKVFKKAAHVYPNHGCLWLSARLLQQKGVLRMPDDARELIEAVFSEDDASVPELLDRRDDQAREQWLSDKSLAHINMLKMEEGYAATINQWREDMHTPTRLGEKETTVRLARWDGTELVPWYDKGDFPWDMSRCSLQESLVNAEAGHDDDPCLANAVERLKEQLLDKGKWSVLVPLSKNKEGCWRGKALNKRQEIVIVKYDPLSGVEISKQEG